MILEISLRAKAGVPKTIVKQKRPLLSLYFPQNRLMLTESRGEFSDLHSIYTLRAFRYSRIRTPFYIFFLNPDYVAGRSLLSLRSNNKIESQQDERIEEVYS